MNIQPLMSDKVAALEALNQYRKHRDVYDKRDWEIERIYRAISQGKVVIDALAAIRRAGLDTRNRPLLAICKADAELCRFDANGDHATFGAVTGNFGWRSVTNKIKVPWSGIGHSARGAAKVPRIPPQHRPTSAKLENYHILWEADWTDIPTDPYLLRRIGKDAWIVLAAWDLTPVERAVLRAHS